MTFADFDGDGEDEMLVMTPRHGDTIKIYKKADGKYTCVKTFKGFIDSYTVSGVRRSWARAWRSSATVRATAT